jgi:hypothetical protein
MIRPEREMTSYDLCNNQVAQIYKQHTKTKNILNVPIMNVILDRIHDVKFQNRVKTPNLDQLRPRVELPSDINIGPGYYDITRFHEYYDHHNSKKHQFCLSKSKRSSSGSLVPESDEQLSLRLSFEASRPNTATTTSDGNLLINPRKHNNGFGKASRWNTSIYKKESYVSTASIGLGPDYDKTHRRLPFGSFSKADHKKGPKLEYQPNPLIIDAGPKASLQASVQLSHRRYASVFKYVIIYNS